MELGRRIRMTHSGRRRAFPSFVFLPIVAIVLCTLAPPAAASGELSRGVRFKLSAGDLWSGEAAVEDYRLKSGVDAEYLDAVGWLARGAVMLGRPDRAAAWVAELRREIPGEEPGLLIPYGAAIEVQGKLLVLREGRGEAIRFLEGELSRAKDTALRSRIRKNLDLLTLEGQPAPELGAADHAGPAPPTLSELRGRPVLLFLWAPGCGDCRAQAPALARLRKTFEPRGLAVVAPTRPYGTAADRKPATPAEEKAWLEKVWSESFAGLDGVAIPIDTETMVRYGVSATPTFVLVDRKGIVRFYTPTRVPESELARRIEELLAETP
jgi:thiol-disulfide isomerase/thioredoxin